MLNDDIQWQSKAKTCEASNISIIGFRVVRGPDWKWGKQDGGEGHVGTVRHVQDNDEIVVLWDNGIIANYRGKSSCDLRVLDNASAGVVHEGSLCDECKESPIFGIRWRCSECNNYDLCSSCYHGGKHFLRHKFWRIITSSSKKILMSPRRKCMLRSFKGLYAGAKVMRGTDWRWDDQDGGIGGKGKIVNIQRWSCDSARNAAYICWDSTDVKNLYRIGYKGMVDVKYLNESKGGSYYKDHLPVLGNFIETCVSESSSFNVGDLVAIDIDLDVLKSVQRGHGGWTDGMLECIGETGTIVGTDSDNNAIVSYPSGSRWTINPVALTKVVKHSSKHSNEIISDLCPGDLVEINSDVDRVKELQKGHGEWTDAMVTVLGQIGRVAQVYADGDVKVEVNGMNLTFSARNLTKVQSKISGEKLQNLLKRVLESQNSHNPLEDLVRSAADGDFQKLTEILQSYRLNIDQPIFGYTALQAASQNGRLNVITVLLNHNADLEKEDNDGDRAIHHAAFGDEPAVIELIARHGCDLNARNKKKQSPLHIAVNKGHKEVVKTLIKLGCHISLQDCDGDTPLHDAITKKRFDILNILVQHDADIAVTNNDGFNCLHYAALRGHTSAVKILLEKLRCSYLIDEPKDDGFTALHLGCLNNHLEACELLLKAGADVNVRTVNWQTPLHLAVERQHMQIVKLLVRHGANVNYQDKDGNTPLHEAIRRHTLLQLKQLQDAKDVRKLLSGGFFSWSIDKSSSMNIAVLLATHDANLDIKNYKGETIWDLCPDPNLRKVLQRAQIEKKSADNTIANQIKNHIQSAQSGNEECMICSENQREVVFLPCAHIATCEVCAVRVKKCLLCKAGVQSTVKVNKCSLCETEKAAILFRPCCHLVVCDKCSNRVKDVCTVCNGKIQGEIKLIDCCLLGEDAGNGREIIAPSFSASADSVLRLQQQLQSIKEQTMCPVCMDHLKNMIFLCGHGTCQLCGDKIKECPICRKPIEKSILLYN